MLTNIQRSRRAAALRVGGPSYVQFQPALPVPFKIQWRGRKGGEQAKTLGPSGLPQASGDRYLPIRAAVAVVLTAAERHRLKKMAYGRKTPHQARQRAAVVLLAARGRGNARIAAETHLHVDTVRA